MDVRFGKQTLTMGSKYLTTLRDSNDIFDDTVQLQSRLHEDGYLLIRGLHNRDTVLQARMEFLNGLNSMGRLREDAPLEKGVINAENKSAMWTPFDDIPLEKGTLALCLGSQHFEQIKQTYGQMDVDRDNVATGRFSEDPIEIVDTFGGQWATTEFHTGDAIIFGMFMMHAH